jgi:AcrR family transcriptional regulator
MATENEDVRSASRALRDAAAAFSRALGQTVAEASVQAGRELADELRQATKDLNDAAVRLGVDPTEVRRSPRAERTRADLLEAARRVFAEKGYEGASVGDVAAAAGYTKGAVYANFGSKEELFLELATELTAIDAAFARPRPGEDVRAAFAPHPASDETLRETLLGLELYIYAIRHPEARADLSPLVVQAYDGLAALVHRAQSGDDGAEPTRQERDTMLGLVAVHTVGAILAPLLPDPDDANGAVARLVDRLLAG